MLKRRKLRAGHIPTVCLSCDPSDETGIVALLRNSKTPLLLIILEDRDEGGAVPVSTLLRPDIPTRLIEADDQDAHASA